MMLARGGGYGDPLAIFDYPPTHPVGYQDTTGKVLVDSAVVPGEKTGIFLVIGQSLACNTCDGGPYTPVNSRAHNFNIYDRKTYQAVDPLLGCVDPWSNYFTLVGDQLIPATFARTIMIPVGVGGIPISMFGVGGIYNHRIQVALRCLPLFGAPLTAVLMSGPGETDNQLGTSQAQYANGLHETIATVRAMGCNAPIFVARESMIGGTLSAAVQNAQAAAVDNVTVFAGPDMDSIPVSERQAADATHLSAVGRQHAANLWQAILSAHFA